MGQRTELEAFALVWDREAQNTLRLLEALPTDKYDFRPDPLARSLGEMAWHLAEIEAYTSLGAAQKRFAFDVKPPNSERPREIKLLAPGFRRVHEEAVERLNKLDDTALDESLVYFDGRGMNLRDILWQGLLHHQIHHRGQLVLLCRLAGGTPPGLFGPNREAMEAMKAARAQEKARV
jgi:uncharacterized damage-inducible protein DinB